MNSIIGLGKYFFAIPIGIFGILHFMAADDMAAMAPGGKYMVYFTGLALLAAAVSMVIGKMDKLASVLLAVILLLFIIPHAQNMASDPGELGNILKNLALAGGALLYAGSYAKDNAVIG
ncbi:MAG: putative oxidoreductase [Saprospiraceae bacterium]|jgi:putative oxidoreductase